MKLRITLDGVTYDLEVEFVDEQASPTPSGASGSAPAIPKPAAAGKPAAAPSKPAAGGGGENTVTSPLSGTVFKVLVKVGDTVQASQDLLILEAMKMETNVVAAMAGTVKNVAVAEGDAVSQGQVLIEFD